MSVPIPDYICLMADYIRPVGSRATCDPPPTDTDEDWLIYIPVGVEFDGHDMLIKDGWAVCGSFIADDKRRDDRRDRFWSYRRGEINIIITRSLSFFHKFMAATSIAKRFNLLVKSDRVALFQAVLYGNACDEIATAPEAFR